MEDGLLQQEHYQKMRRGNKKKGKGRIMQEGLKTTPCSECTLNALAIDEPLEYARLYLEGNMQIWVDAEDSLELW